MGASDIVVTAASSVTTEQLIAGGPITGPSHRTYVPIVRNTSEQQTSD